MSEITWGDLTAEELAALRLIKTEDHIDDDVFDTLLKKQLIYCRQDRDDGSISTFYTSLGQRVLAQASKPDYVTAAEFVRDNYMAKIIAGECIVRNSDGMPIIHHASDTWGHYNLAHYYDGEKYIGKLYAPSDKLTVTWLPQPAAAPTASGEGVTVGAKTIYSHLSLGQTVKYLGHESFSQPIPTGAVGVVTRLSEWSTVRFFYPDDDWSIRSDLLEPVVTEYQEKLQSDLAALRQQLEAARAEHDADIQTVRDATNRLFGVEFPNSEDGSLTDYDTLVAHWEDHTMKLQEALKPFAEAYKEIPNDLRSTLRIWNPEAPTGITGLSATTDHLQQAAAALAGSEGA